MEGRFDSVGSLGWRDGWSESYISRVSSRSRLEIEVGEGRFVVEARARRF